LSWEQTHQSAVAEQAVRLLAHFQFEDVPVPSFRYDGYVGPLGSRLKLYELQLQIHSQYRGPTELEGRLGDASLQESVQTWMPSQKYSPHRRRQMFRGFLMSCGRVTIPRLEPDACTCKITETPESSASNGQVST